MQAAKQVVPYCHAEGCLEDGVNRILGEWYCHAHAIQPAEDVMRDATGRHPNSARFHAILTELGSLHDRKQADYGRGDDPFANVRASEDWGMAPWVGAMVRATDKLRRLQTFATTGSLANEGVADSLKDLAVYAIIALVLFEQGK